MNETLKEYRIKLGLSQEEIADKIGCTRSQYVGIECGYRNGNMDFWRKLQQAFNIPGDEMWDLYNNK